MSDLIPGNQKHLSLDNRIFIEKSLENAMPFKEIAKYLCKDLLLFQKRLRNIVPLRLETILYLLIIAYIVAMQPHKCL